MEKTAGRAIFRDGRMFEGAAAEPGPASPLGAHDIERVLRRHAIRTGIAVLSIVLGHSLAAWGLGAAAWVPFRRWVEFLDPVVSWLASSMPAAGAIAAWSHYAGGPELARLGAYIVIMSWIVAVMLVIVLASSVPPRVRAARRTLRCLAATASRAATLRWAALVAVGIVAFVVGVFQLIVFEYYNIDNIELNKKTLFPVVTLYSILSSLSVFLVYHYMSFLWLLLGSAGRRRRP